MAKGRKLTISRSERLLGSFSFSHGHENGSGGGSELREDDVWSSFDDRVNDENHFDNDSSSEWNTRAAPESNGSLSSLSSYRSRRHPPRADHSRQVGGLSLAFDDLDDTAPSRILHQHRAQERVMSSPHRRHMATSAPVNVPDWSKIYRVDSVESLHDSDDCVDDHESEWLPPHEYLAREYARTGKTSTNSVFEGVGRTLKGRDLSRVRDAVWSQTGFNG